MSEKFISINPDIMEVGKFYSVYTNKDNATLTIEKTVVDTALTDIGQLQTDSNAQAEAIGTLETTVNGHTSSISTLSTDNTTNKSDISSLKSDNTTNKSNISTLQGNVTTMQSDITTLQQNSGHSPEPVGQCWVSPSGLDTNNGGVASPFKTIQKALDSTFGLINVLPGSYTENLTLPTSYGQYGPIIAGTGTVESPKSELLGTITIPANTSRLRIKNMNLHSSAGSTITDNGSNGRHILENCTVDHTTLGSDVITINNGKNWFTLVSSTVIGNINLTGTPTVGQSFNMMNCPNDFSCKPIVNAGYLFTAYNVGKMGKITHNGGYVYCTNIGAWYPTSGNIISSTSVSPLDVIGVGYSSFSADGINYGKIASTGATVMKNFNVESPYGDGCLLAVSNVLSTIVPQTAVTLVAEIKKLEQNISYNATTGELTFLKTGIYDVSITLKIDCTEWDKRIDLWFEKYNTGTSTWDLVADSGFRQNFQTDQESVPHFDFSNIYFAGDKYRLRAKSNSDNTILLKTITLDNGVKMPAIRISIS